MFILKRILIRLINLFKCVNIEKEYPNESKKTFHNFQNGFLTNMRMAGDLSDEERILSQELEEMELILDDKFKQRAIDIDRIAKGYVCISHDWYALNCEEEGNRVLDKSEIVCPGYFENFVQKHIAEDAFYANIVKSLDTYLTFLLMDNLKGIKLRDEE